MWTILCEIQFIVDKALQVLLNPTARRQKTKEGPFYEERGIFVKRIFPFCRKQELLWILILRIRIYVMGT